MEGPAITLDNELRMAINAGFFNVGDVIGFGNDPQLFRVAEVGEATVTIEPL